jgi:hypothetical protein
MDSIHRICIRKFSSWIWAADLECQNLGDTHGDTANLVSFIVENFEMSLLSHNLLKLA